MKLVHAASELRALDRKICVTIGTFDGVHLGHQQIIRQTVADARQRDGIALVVTFDSHPASVVAPQRAPGLIQTVAQKLRVISSLGPDALLLLHFDRAFSEQTGEQFIRSLVRDLGTMSSICVGHNFVFGHNRTGDVALLKRLGEELQFSVNSIAPVSLDGLPVSSTRIREAIRAGNLEAAGRMLGRAFTLAGRVVQGDGIGRQLGFPTANLDVAGLVLPPNGVYAAHAQVGNERHRAVLNIGLRPTLHRKTPQLTVEVHLLDFSGDLYGRQIEITFLSRLRDEEKFASTAELKAQIARDVAGARRLFQPENPNLVHHPAKPENEVTSASGE